MLGEILSYVVVSFFLGKRHIPLEIFEIWNEHILQIGVERRPVVHLYVDVMPISGCPGGVIVSVPCALEVCGETAASRGGDKKISSVLEIKCLEIRGAGAVFILGKKVVGGKGKVALVKAEIERYSSEKLLIIGKVVCL